MEDKDFLYKDEVLQEALREFANKGYDSASLNQIIKRSGISKGSFYHHFGNKENLFYKVLERVAEEKLAFITEWTMQKDVNPDDLGFFEILEMMMAGGLEFGLQRPELSVFLMNIMKNPDLKSKAQSLLPQYYNQIFDPLVEAAVKRGELRSDMESAFIAKLIKYSFLNLSDFLLEGSIDILDRSVMEIQIKQFLQFLRDGLKPQSSN